MATSVEKLKKRIEGNREERAAYQRMYDRLQENIRMIVEAPQKLRYPFWCDECKSDFMGIGYKVMRKLRARLPIGWWVAYCPARHKCIRRITDRSNDPYFVKSFIVKRDRARYRDDLLTPDDHRFWLLYGHKHGSDLYKTIDKKATAHELSQERKGK